MKSSQIKIAFLICGLIAVTNGFPDGAPADACVRKERINQPNHGAARSQPINTLPYIVVASSDRYQPGQKITVQIYPAHNPNQLFKGFFLQARDVETNEWIGQWDQLRNIKTIPECSAVTHADPKSKTGATLVWNAPQHKSGQVYFTGTVVQDYGTFWGDLVAAIAAPQQLQHQQQQQQQQQYQHQQQPKQQHQH